MVVCFFVLDRLVVETFFDFDKIDMYTTSDLKPFIKAVFNKNIPEIHDLDLLVEWATLLIDIPNVELSPPGASCSVRDNYLQFVQNNDEKVQRWCDEGYHYIVRQIEV
jgi:hypothetical protein